MTGSRNTDAEQAEEIMYADSGVKLATPQTEARQLPSDTAQQFLFGTWYPIETAPKDGTKILLFEPTFTFSSRIEIGSWKDKEDANASDDGWFDDNYDDFSMGSSYGHLRPTHWMPLPPAPEAKPSKKAAAQQPAGGIEG